MGGENATEAWQIVQQCRGDWPRASFLAGLDTPALRDFLEAGKLAHFQRGEDLIREGDPTDDTFLLLSATVKVTARLDDGGSALLAVRLGGDIVGEQAAMDGGERSASVSVCDYTPVDAVQVGRDEFHDALSRHPAAATALAAALSRKLRSATRRHIDSTNCTAKVRLARAVLELAEDYGQASLGGTVIGVNLTRIELGTLVGVRETTAQRALRDLKGDGVVVDFGRQRLLVPDLAALRTVAKVS